MGTKMGCKRTEPKQGLRRTAKQKADPKPRAKKTQKAARKPAAPSDKQIMKIWSLVVRTRAAFECELWGVNGQRCGSIMDAHHIYSRRHKATKFDLENGLCVCKGHHIWIHNNPVASTDAIKELIGQKRYNALKELHLTTCKLSADERREIYAELKAELDRLEAKAA